MIWVANVLLIASLILIGRAARGGWALNAAGNAIWLAVTASRHQFDYASLSVVFLAIAVSNLRKTPSSQSPP